MRNSNGMHINLERPWCDVKLCLVLVRVIDFDLKTTTISVLHQNYFCSAKRVYAFAHAWYSVETPFSNCDEFLVNNAKLESSVLLGYEYYRCCSFGSCGLYDVFDKHFVNFRSFKFARLWSWSVRCQEYWCCDRLQLLEAVFCHCETAKKTISH